MEVCRKKERQLMLDNTVKCDREIDEQKMQQSCLQ